MSAGKQSTCAMKRAGSSGLPLPSRRGRRMPYLCRHGFGYTVFEYTENGISSELWVYVAIDAPVKFAVLKVRNSSGRTRNYRQPPLRMGAGEMRHKGLMHVVTEVDAQCGALLARNPYSIEFPDRIAFFDVNDPSRSLTGDRTEFLGRNRDAGQPAAMGRTRLSGKIGAGWIPAAPCRPLRSGRRSGAGDRLHTGSRS
jgi:cyclic beta-1,2-glucan synthetase